MERVVAKELTTTRLFPALHPRLRVEKMHKAASRSCTTTWSPSVIWHTHFGWIHCLILFCTEILYERSWACVKSEVEHVSRFQISFPEGLMKNTYQSQIHVHICSHRTAFKHIHVRKHKISLKRHRQIYKQSFSFSRVFFVLLSVRMLLLVVPYIFI